jgi:hypothetical protein
MATNKKHLHVKEILGKRSFRIEILNEAGHGHLEIYLKGKLIGYLHLMGTLRNEKRIEILSYDRNGYELVPSKG